uniref:F-box domain-containing protein n=2 Tax=Aegilops tauschii subsp. strangulata TaxID=200361 RepID=A0A452ZV55_AEGTS
HRLAPYRIGWLSRRRQGDAGGDNLSDHDNGTLLPDDALSAVFARCSGYADVVRCASTCRRWGRVVAQEAAVLSRCRALALPPLPRLFLGFFQREDGAAGRVTARKCAAVSRPGPRFVPTRSGARLLGLPSASLGVLPDAFHDVVGRRFFEHSRPVASRNGRLVLELRHEGRAAGLELCVCNPMTGHMALLPPLSGDDMPGTYACALFAGEHDGGQGPSPLPATFFRLLIVYNRRGFTALRAYSSDLGRWSEEARRSGRKIKSAKVRELGQAMVLRGVAYWPLLRTALAVRIDTPEPREAPMPQTGLPTHMEQSTRLLGVTADERLCCITSRVCVDRLCMTVDLFDPNTGDRGEWEFRPGFFMPPQAELKLRSYLAVNLRWFCERSGVVLFTLGEGSGRHGTFAFNVRTREVDEIVAGVHCDSWRLTSRP